MREYYSGRRAQTYDAVWARYTATTHDAAYALIDFAALDAVPARLGRGVRLLDVACGTGALLRRLGDRLPNAELYGVDASADMLAKARSTLSGQPRVHLLRADMNTGAGNGLPYAPAMFDLITCVNALHYMTQPVAVLAGLRQLLAPQGQLVLVDFARRPPPFPWPPFAWLLRRVDPQYVRAFTAYEAQELSARAGFTIVSQTSRHVHVDWLWHAWALRLATGQ